jgi:hypothetical protein
MMGRRDRRGKRGRGPFMDNVITDRGGFIGVGLLLAFMVVISVFVLVCEYYRAFTIRKSVIVELSRALNSSIEMSIMDEYRKDHISRLDEDIANETFN